jgi:hypothetical protein
MRKFLVYFIFSTLLFSTACGKKKKSSTPTANPAPAANNNPYPAINPNNINPSTNNVPSSYCGASTTNILSSYGAQYFYDPNYGVSWYSYGDIWYYYYQGYWWYYGNSGNCQSLSNYTSYYYQLTYAPSVCYTCQQTCHSGTCGNNSTPTDSDYPTTNYNTCTGKFKSFNTTYSKNWDLSKGIVYTTSVTLNESQTYYLIFDGNYTGKPQLNEEAELCIDGNNFKTIKDLDNSTSNSSSQNKYHHQCYIELCLNKGDHKLQFRALKDSLVLNKFTFTTTKPSSMTRCDQ